MKDKLRSSLSSLLLHANAFLGNPGRDKIRILTYHRVNDERPGYLSVPVSRFREQMSVLAENGYRTIGLEELVSRSPSPYPSPKGRGNESLSPEGRGQGEGGKRIIITFDDGYEDNYLNAFPIMREIGFTGTVFCVSGRVGKPEYLTLDQIREMSQDGFSFGSHTISHPDLRKLSRQDKNTEIVHSKSQLEQELGKPCNFFCYPFGLYDEESLEILKAAGYLGACSNRPGGNSVNGRKENPFLLRRTEIGPRDGRDEFFKKLAGAYDGLHQALHWMRGRP